MAEKKVDNEDQPNDEGRRFVQDLISRTNSAKKESPRAYVIVMTAHVDNFLTNMLRSYLCVPRNDDDELFRSSGPLYNFGPRVDLAYRLGLISPELTWLLHQVRKLRDECAHLTDEVDLDRDPFKARITSMHSRLNTKRLKKAPDAITKFETIIVSSLIWLWYQNQPHIAIRLMPHEPEWVFTDISED